MFSTQHNKPILIITWRLPSKYLSDIYSKNCTENHVFLLVTFIPVLLLQSHFHHGVWKTVTPSNKDGYEPRVSGLLSVNIVYFIISFIFIFPAGVPFHKVDHEIRSWFVSFCAYEKLCWYTPGLLMNILGDNPGNPSVKARYFCIFSGWSPYGWVPG